MLHAVGAVERSKEEFMDARLTAFGAAMTVALSMPLAAQPDRIPASGKEITLTGCVEKNKSGGYWLTDAVVGDRSDKTGSSTTTTASSSTTTASSATTTGTSGSRAVDNDVRSATNNRMWNLGTQKDVEKYLNQKVEVVGKPKNDTSGDQLKGTKGGEMQARDFDVKSIRMVAASCK
jgi:hypothetical protein